MGYSKSPLAGLEEFTCAMYGRRQFKDVNVLRYMLIKERCGLHDGSINLNTNIDRSNLPPCRRALTQHILRANFQMAIWRRAATSVVDMPEPTDGHGWTHHEGNMVPLWFEGSCLPEILIDNDNLMDVDEDSDEDTDESSAELDDDDTYIYDSAYDDDDG